MRRPTEEGSGFVTAVSNDDEGSPGDELRGAAAAGRPRAAQQGPRPRHRVRAHRGRMLRRFTEWRARQGHDDAVRRDDRLDVSDGGGCHYQVALRARGPTAATL